jgi:hypothetical protein
VQKKVFSAGSKFSAAWLLLVFSLSILPARHLHEAFSHHQDHYSSCSHSAHQHDSCIYDASLVCKISLQVVDLPFNSSEVLFIPCSEIKLNRLHARLTEGVISGDALPVTNKGPPNFIS